MKQRLLQASKFLSYILRHQPDAIGLSLDREGWASLDKLAHLSQSSKVPLTREMILEVVATNDKQRFRLSEDGLCIRASQGHTIPVDLGLIPREPPGVLYHGTASRFMDSILYSGLHQASRHYVHLSRDPFTAKKVGERHGGEAVILTIDANTMVRDGYLFHLSENGVWLTDHVPARYLTIISPSETMEDLPNAVSDEVRKRLAAV